MTRLPFLIAMLAITVLPWTSAAQKPVEPRAEVGRYGEQVSDASNEALDEVFRRLDEQERELSSLRQLVGVDSDEAYYVASDAAGAERDPNSVSLLNQANRVKLHAGLDTLMVFSTCRPLPSGMGEYNGGIVQSFNPVTLAEIRSAGGFGELFCYLTDQFHVHVGYGIDHPRTADLAPTQIRQNQTYFINLVWDLSHAMQLGFEVDYRRTDYTQFAPNAFLDSDGVVFATRFQWRF